MKKIIYYLLLFLTVITTGYSQVIVGTGTNNQQFVPFNPYSHYSYSQTIYLADEISSSAGDITSIGWYYQGVSNISNSQDITIYMGLTDKKNFNSTTDYVSVNDLVKVYEGPIITDGIPGWKTVIFNQVDKFNWDGIKNLIIAVDENHPGGDPLANDGGVTPTDKFYCTEKSSYRSISTHSQPVSSSSDQTVNIDPVSPNQTGTTINQRISAYIPNILLGIQQTCPAPTELAVTNIKTNSATISWKILDPLPGGTSQYFITQNSPLNPIIPNKNTIATGALVNGAADNISGLKHSTSYKIWVRNLCSDTDTGNWSEAYSFTTLCDINTGIYVQNFDAVTTPLLPNCWKGIVTKIDGVSSATVANGGVRTASSGNGNALYMNNPGSSGDYYIMAVSPELDNMHNGNYRLKFSARVSSISGGPTYLEIGTVTLNSDGTFSNYEVVKENIVLTTTLETQEPIDFLVGMLQRNDNKRIAFRIGTSSPQGKNIYVDDIHWEPIPPCGDVSAVSVVGVQGTDVSIAWNSVQNDSTTGDIVITEDPLISDPSGLTPKLTNVPVPAVLENLKEDTNYRAWVRSYCDTDNRGSYIGPVTFRTNCAYKSSFEENFDGMIDKSLPACWTGIKRNGASSGAGVETSTNAAVSGHNSVRLFAGGSVGVYEIILVSPPLSNLNQGTHRVRFYSKDKFEVGTLNHSGESAIFTPVKAIEATGLVGGMIEQTVDIPSTTDSHLGFRMVNEPDFIYIYKDVYIDNIIWEPIPPCVDVKKPTLNKISTDNAEIIWTPGGGEGKWHVTHSTTNVLPTTPTFTTVLPESANLVGDGRIKTTIDGLSSSTTYYVWVRSNCDVDSSTNLINGRWIGPIAITTECNDVEEYSENFDTVSNPNLPDCWSAIFTGGEGVLSPYASIKTNAGKVRMDVQFSLPDAKIILVGPNTRSLGELKNYRLKFEFEYRQNITLEIGALDGKLATATFTPIKQINLTSSSEPNQIVYFDDSTYAFNGIDNHIGIRLLSDASFQAPSVVLDNIVWEKIPSCLEVSGVTVKSTTINSAILSWVKGKTETAWQISVNPVSATEPSTATSDLVTASTNVDFSLNNLKDGEQYKIWIRSKCSDTNFSGWSSPVIFNTLCDASDLPFVEDFEQISTFNLPICGSTFTGKVSIGDIEYTSTPWNIYLQTRNGFNSNTMRYAGNSSLTGNAWYFTRGINLEAGKSYAISYLYGSNTDLNSASRLQVKFGTEATVEAMTTLIADHTATGDLPNVTYFPRTATPVLKTFTVPTTGVYYFGYYAYSQPSQSAVFIDDINIDVNLSSDEFKTDLLRYYPNPVTDVLNISYISNITAVSVYNMLGQEVIRSKANGVDTINQIDMSQLNNGTYIVRISADDLTKTIKVIKQ
ncbi:MAG: T9SS type A sorting domain-containing protein [Flavobacterium sp.]